MYAIFGSSSLGGNLYNQEELEAIPTFEELLLSVSHTWEYPNSTLLTEQEQQRLDDVREEDVLYFAAEQPSIRVHNQQHQHFQNPSNRPATPEEIVANRIRRVFYACTREERPIEDICTLLESLIGQRERYASLQIVQSEAEDESVPRQRHNPFKR